MVSIEMAMLRVAEADRDENDDIASANAQVWAQRWTAMDQRLAIARRAVAILENELQRLAQFAPKQQAQAGQAPPAQARIAPVRRDAKEAQGG